MNINEIKPVFIIINGNGIRVPYTRPYTSVKAAKAYQSIAKTQKIVKFVPCEIIEQ